jgi:hypothetical protein
MKVNTRDNEKEIICPKCGAVSGDSWANCEGKCPMPFSPYYLSKNTTNTLD